MKKMVILQRAFSTGITFDSYSSLPSQPGISIIPSYLAVSTKKLVITVPG